MEQKYRVHFELHGQGVDKYPKGLLSIDKESGMVYVHRAVDYEDITILKVRLNTYYLTTKLLCCCTLDCCKPVVVMTSWFFTTGWVEILVWSCLTIETINIHSLVSVYSHSHSIVIGNMGLQKKVLVQRKPYPGNKGRIYHYSWTRFCLSALGIALGGFENRLEEMCTEVFKSQYKRHFSHIIFFLYILINFDSYLTICSWDFRPWRTF